MESMSSVPLIDWYKASFWVSISCIAAPCEVKEYLGQHSVATLAGTSAGHQDSPWRRPLDPSHSPRTSSVETWLEQREWTHQVWGVVILVLMCWIYLNNLCWMTWRILKLCSSMVISSMKGGHDVGTIDWRKQCWGSHSKWFNGAKKKCSCRGSARVPL